MKLYEIKKRADIPTVIIYIYITTININESTITDRITYLTNTDVLENNSSNNKDSYYLKDNTKDLQTPHKYEVKTPHPTDHPSQNHNYEQSTLRSKFVV